MGSMDLTAGSRRGFWPPAGRRWVPAAVLAALVLAGSVVALVDAGGRDSSRSPGGETAPDPAMAFDGDEAAAVRSPAADTAVPARAGAGAPEPPPGAGPEVVEGVQPRIVRQAQLGIEVADGSVGRAFDRVAELAGARGGFVVSSTTSGLDSGEDGIDGPRARLTVRVPSESFEATRNDLAGLGEVVSVQITGEDVTARLVDLDARLRALRAEEEALTTLMGSAANVGEVLSVRERLSSTRAQIEQLAAQQASLDDQASFATIDVSLAEAGAAPATVPSEPASGLARSVDQALDGALAVVGGVIVVVGYGAPVVAMVLLAWGGWRLAGRLHLRRRAA